MLAADDAASALEHTLADDIDFSIGNNFLQKPPLAVVLNNGQGLPSIGLEAVFDRFFLVILADDQFSAVFIADTILGRLIVLDVIGGLALGAEASAGSPEKNFFIRDIQVDDAVERAAGGCKDDIQSVCLGNGSGKAIQDKSVHGVGFIKTFFDDGGGYVIRDQAAFIDKSACDSSQGSRIFEVFTEEVARGERGHRQILAQESRMGSFTAARRSHNDQVQRAGDGRLFGQAIGCQELIDPFLNGIDGRRDESVIFNALDKSAHFIVDRFGGILRIDRQE